MGRYGYSGRDVIRMVTKVSDIAYTDVAEYLRLTELSETDINMLNTLLNVAKGYVADYTGRTAAEIDTFPDFVIAVYILVQDMWDNRAYYVDKSNVNVVVQSILDLHSVNLL